MKFPQILQTRRRRLAGAFSLVAIFSVLAKLADFIQIFESELFIKIWNFLFKPDISVPIWLIVCTIVAGVLAWIIPSKGRPQTRQSPSQPLYTKGEFHRKLASLLYYAQDKIEVCCINETWVFKHIILLGLARMRGVEISVVIPEHDDAERHALLECLGCNIYRANYCNGRPPFEGVVIDGDSPSHGAAITMSIKESEGCYAQFHTSPHDFYVIMSCSAFISQFVTQERSGGDYRPSVEAVSPEEVYERLREVRFYRSATFKHVEISLEDALPIASVVESAKVFQAEQLIGLYENKGWALFAPAALVLSNGNHSLIVPPVVELHGNVMNVAEGHSRLFALRRKGVKNVKVILVEGADAQPPSKPLNWRAVVCNDEKEPVDNPELARRIESTAHKGVWG